MGKITPRFFFLTFIVGLFLLSADTALANLSYGPEKPVAKKQHKQSFFVGFYLDAAPTINLENNSPASCSDANDGSLTINVSGGETPYTYSWSGPGDGSSFRDDPTISNLLPGEYFITVTDANGDSVDDTFTVEFEDNQIPTIVAPADITIDTDNNQCTGSNVNLGSPTTNDNCGIKSITNDAPSVFPIGETTVTWTVTDNAGNTATATQKVTVEDNEAPTITAPADLVIDSDTGSCDASNISLGNSTTNDNCGVDSVINDAPASFPLGETTVTWTITDDAGNTATATQKVTVEDNEAPTITAPADLVIDSDSGSCDATNVSLGNSTTNDNCGVDSVINDAPASFPLGETTVTWTVTDDSGNTASATQKVTVEDTEDPTASNPEPINVQCITDVPEADPSVVTDAADNCTSNPEVKFVSDSSDGNSNPEVITRTYSVTDEAGNFIEVTQKIKVDDTIEPTASNPEPINVQCATDVPDPDPSVVTDEADNCTSNPEVKFVSDSSDGDSNPEVITRTYSVTDEAGNFIEVTQKITVDDTIEPTASNPDPISVQCAADVPNPDPSVVTDEADNCTSNPEVEFVSDSSDGNSNPEVITRTYSVTDEAGNFIEVTQEITVDDTEAPEIPELPDITGECPVTVTPPITTDNCDGEVTGTTGVSDLTFTESSSIIWIFTDAAGNETEAVEQKIIISDTTAPVPKMDNLQERIIEGCQISSIEELKPPEATDACEGLITGILSSSFQFPYSTPGTDVITWEFTDSNGNKSFQEQDITFKPVTINGGTIKGTYQSTEFEDLIEITSCADEISIDLQLIREVGQIVRWERLNLNDGEWETINNSSNTLTTEFEAGELESTSFRVRIQEGTCIQYSDVFDIKALPTGPKPEVTNLGSDSICLGDDVNLKATIDGIATPGDAIPGSEGDFHTGQFKQDWLVDGDDGGFTCGGNNEKTRNWSCTSKAHDFGDITYDSGSKFAVAQGNFFADDGGNGNGNGNGNGYSGNIPTTLETPVIDLSNALSATLDFDQAYHFVNDDIAVIEISIDGGETYSSLRVMHAEGTGTKTWFTAGTAESTDGSTNKKYNFHTDNTSISLQEYLGEKQVRIRWSFTGTSDKSIWALDNLLVRKNASINSQIEWTEGIGDPDEDPIAIGEKEATITFQPDTPGIHEYGGTTLINGCRTYNEEGTNLVKIEVSYPYAGEDILNTDVECGQNEVQLNAYDNRLTAEENFSNGAYKLPEDYNEEIENCKKCDAPGTQVEGEWSILEGPESSTCSSAIFSDSTLPDATFEGPAGTYTLRWTLENGCFDDVVVTLTECNQVNFDGIDDHVDFDDNYDLSGAFSLEVWVKPESTNGTQTIFSKRDSGSEKGYDLSMQDGIVSFNWDGSGSIASPHQIDSDRWYHISLTHSLSGEYRLFIDGLRVKLTGGNSPGGNQSKAILGAIESELSPQNFFNGWMEELRIWNTALTEDQLHIIMNQRIKKVNTNYVEGEEIPIVLNNLKWDNLIGYYRMDNTGCGNLIPHDDIGVTGKLKNITSSQTRTAPLPYIATGGDWWNKNSWKESQIWDPPNSTGVNDEKIDWNIARLDGETLNNPATSDNSINLLGLLDEGGILTMEGSNNSNGNALTITHYLKLDGHIDLNGESQLVQTEGSILEGSGYLTRDQQGTASSYNYNYWSSPVVSNTGNQSYTIASVMHDGTDEIPKKLDIGPTGHVTYADGPATPVGIPKKISGRWLYKFRGDANQYSQWEYVGKDGTLLPGEGYTMKGTSGIADIEDLQNYTFKGFPNNGPISLNIGKDQNYLLGNPYPSAIEARQFILDNLDKNVVAGATNTANIFNGALYFWDHFGGKTHILREYVGGYATINLSGAVQSASSVDQRINSNDARGTKKPGQFIPVGQGFFVNTVLDPSLADDLTISGGNINFNNGQRAFATEANTNDSQFLKPIDLTKGPKTVKTKDSRYKIRLNFTSPLGYQRQILVTADAYTTNGFDLGYDALSNDNIPEDMFWLIKENKFVIQGVPNFNLDQKLPIGLKIAEEKEFSIELGELENVPDIIDIYLRDNSDSTYHDLRKEAFKASLPAGEYQDLYEIVFHDVTSTRNDKEPGEGPIDYYYSLDNREFVISNPELHKIEHINIYNIAGQLVDQHFGIPDLKEIHVPQKKSLSSAVYIVKVYTDAGDYAKKVIIRKD